MNWKKIVRSPRALITFTLILVSFFLIDWLTKYFWFDAKNVTPNGGVIPGTEKDYIVFGVRSIPHNNTTIFSAFNVSLPLWSTYLINFTISVIIFIIAYFNISTLLGVGLGIMLAGVLGNSFDILTTTTKVGGVNHFVRDILYLPWRDNGTFNFADIWIVAGAALILFGVILSFFIGGKEEKAKVEESISANTPNVTNAEAKVTNLKKSNHDIKTKTINNDKNTKQKLSIKTNNKK